MATDRRFSISLFLKSCSQTQKHRFLYFQRTSIVRSHFWFLPFVNTAKGHSGAIKRLYIAFVDQYRPFSLLGVFFAVRKHSERTQWSDGTFTLCLWTSIVRSHFWEFFFAVRKHSERTQWSDGTFTLRLWTSIERSHFWELVGGGSDRVSSASDRNTETGSRRCVGPTQVFQTRSAYFNDPL